jgi:redox-sensitive bicupin YhaK (pirin superfamily)
VNLAPEHKMIAPSYQDVPPERVPVHTRGAAEVRVLVGRSVLSAAGEAAAATTLSPVTLLDVAWAGAPAGAVHAERVEPGHEGFVYVYRGSVTVNGRTLVEGDCALLGPAAR